MAITNPQRFTFTATQSSGNVSALLLQPKDAIAMLVLAHGAGANMEHKFMEAAAVGLAEQGIATLRFNFPYMENKKKYPDPTPVAVKTVCSAVEFALSKTKLPLFAGGKSFGGRMTSMAAAQKLIPQVKGLVYFGYPLHAPGKQSTERAEHLYSIEQPMLFLQGTKDTLAEISLIREVCAKLGKKTTLHEVTGGDHSFHVSKARDEEVLKGLCGVVGEWLKVKNRNAS